MQARSGGDTLTNSFSKFSFDAGGRRLALTFLFFTTRHELQAPFPESRLNNLVAMKLSDLIVIVSQFPQNRVGLFPERGNRIESRGALG